MSDILTDFLQITCAGKHLFKILYLMINHNYCEHQNTFYGNNKIPRPFPLVEKIDLLYKNSSS